MGLSSPWPCSLPACSQWMSNYIMHLSTMFVELSLMIGGSGKQCISSGRQTASVLRYRLRSVTINIPHRGDTKPVRDPWSNNPKRGYQPQGGERNQSQRSVKHWNRRTHNGQQERVEFPYGISAPCRIRRTLSRPTLGRANSGVAQVESTAFNPKNTKTLHGQGKLRSWSF